MHDHQVIKPKDAGLLTIMITQITFENIRYITRRTFGARIILAFTSQSQKDSRVG